MCSVLWMFIVNNILPCIAVSILFQTPVDIAYGVLDSVYSIQKPVTTVLQCAILCSQTSDCVTFRYTQANETCLVSNGVIPDSGGAVYGITPGPMGCPPASNYKLYRSGHLMLCLKLVPTAHTQPAAKNDCMLVDGHLLFVENEEVWRFARNIIIAYGMGFARVDGEDVLGDNKFKNWKGKELTYIPWGGSDPSNSDEDCLGMASEVNFQVKDGQCQESAPYICQMS